MTLEFLSSTKQKLFNISAALGGGSQASDPHIEMFHTKLVELSKIVSELKVDLSKYADSVVATAMQSSKLGMDFLTIYRHSEARQKSLAIFADTMRELQTKALHTWNDVFHNEVLAILDSWNVQLDFLLRRTNHVKKLFIRIAKSKQSNSEDAAAIAAMQSDFEKSKNELNEIVKMHIESRYAVLDAVLVRLMECQIEYQSASTASISGLDKHVSSYRKRFPKGSIPDILQPQPTGRPLPVGKAPSSSNKSPQAVWEEDDEPSSDEQDTTAAPELPIDKGPENVSEESRTEPHQAESMHQRAESEPVDLLFGFDSSIMPPSNTTNSSHSNQLPFDHLSSSTSTSSPSVSIDQLLFTNASVDSIPLASFNFGANYDQPVNEAASAFMYMTGDSGPYENVHKDSNPNIRTLRAQLDAEENMKNAKDRAKDNVSFQLDNWEFGIGLQRKNIRILLSTMHNVLPAVMNFTPVKMTDLSTAANVKKMTRKAMLAVHPDKIDRDCAERLVICERVFHAIQVEFKAFEESGLS